MNAAPPQKINNAQFLKEIAAFEKNCQQHNVGSAEIEHIFEMLSQKVERDAPSPAKVSSTSNPQENAKISKALQSLLLTVRGSKSVLEAAASSVPPTKLERVVAGCLERFNKDFKANLRRVTAKENAKKT